MKIKTLQTLLKHAQIDLNLASRQSLTHTPMNITKARNSFNSANNTESLEKIQLTQHDKKMDSDQPKIKKKRKENGQPKPSDSSIPVFQYSGVHLEVSLFCLEGMQVQLLDQKLLALKVVDLFHLQYYFQPDIKITLTQKQHATRGGFSELPLGSMGKGYSNPTDMGKIQPFCVSCCGGIWG